jgi:predicted TIM-barrel fold metal-dependent hydrolase
MIIDSHVHLIGTPGTMEQRVDRLLHFADKHGIERLVVSLGDQLRHQPTADDLRRDNDYLLEAVAYRPDRLTGYCYASPAHPEVSVAEIDRTIAGGPFRGIKMWICRYCDDPGSDPICERAAALGVPLLQHTWIKVNGNYPTESRPEHLVNLARRHPRVQFLMAHCGGDWPRGIRVVRHVPNITVDVCGGHPEQGQVELAVKLLGVERVVWGSDAGGRSFASQLAKVYAAPLSDHDRELILAGNIQRMIGL